MDSLLLASADIWVLAYAVLIVLSIWVFIEPYHPIDHINRWGAAIGMWFAELAMRPPNCTLCWGEDDPVIPLEQHWSRLP